MSKDSTFSGKRLINCKSKLLDLSTPAVMGILNLTPDSFFENSRAKNVLYAAQQVEKMLNEGAKVIDIGGQSTRPGSKRIDETEELRRIADIVGALTKSFPNQLFSIDTYFSSVAKVAVSEGASIVNDISSGTLDLKMIPWIAKSKTAYIASHFRGQLGQIPTQSLYRDVASEVTQDLSKITQRFSSLGHQDLIIDPGFGFGKTMNDNFKLLHQLENLQILNTPVLVGISRKSMIWKTLKSTAQQSLNGTTVLNTIALIKGAKILRVHDVAEAVEAVRLVGECR